MIPVYKIEYTKEFDPPAVNSFDKTPVEVTIEVTNAGTANLNEVTIEDNLPDDVMPPTSEHITVWIKGEEYTGAYDFAIDPEDQDPEKPPGSFLPHMFFIKSNVESSTLNPQIFGLTPAKTK